MENIGILGGTFDPVHKGHINLATQAQKALSLDKVVFLPLGDPPHKNKPIANGQTRLKLIEKSIEKYSTFKVMDFEIKRKGKTYTIDTLLYLKENFPTWNVYYIIGSDTLYDLSSWREIEKIFALCTFVCQYRVGARDVREKAKEYEEKYNAKIVFLQGEGLDVSSTMVRQHETLLIPKEIMEEYRQIYCERN